MKFFIYTASSKSSLFYFNELRKNSYFVDIMKGRLVVKDRKGTLEAAFDVDLESRARSLLYIACFLLVPTIMSYVAGFPAVFVFGLVFCFCLVAVYLYTSKPYAFYHKMLWTLRKLGHKDQVVLRWSN